MSNVYQVDNTPRGEREHEDTLESSGYRELHDITTETPKEILNFASNDLRWLRGLLRLLSLWRPPTAGVFEGFIYPVIINLLLLLAGVIRNAFQAAQKPSWVSIQSMYIVHEIGIWLGHILGNYYFRSGDLANLLPRQPLPGVTKPLRRRLKCLKWAILLSLAFFSVMLCTVFIVSQLQWNEGTKRFTSDLPGIHGTLDHVLYAVVLVTIFYDLGIGLALSWTMSLLYICYASRLKALEGIFLKWRKPTNEAIYFFQLVYSRPVQHSWKRISWWFLAHNVIAVAIPMYGYELAQAQYGNGSHSKYLPQFICYLIFVLTIWLTPIIMAEQIKRSEKKFQENVNNFCFGLLKETREYEPSMTRSNGGSQTAVTYPTTGSSHVGISGDTTGTCYMFASRGKELRYFLHFLKNRAQGLVARGYSLQLNLSVVSLFVGIVSFLIKLNKGQTMSMDIIHGASANNTL